MKVIIVGASGTIGQAVTRDLEKDHDVIRAGIDEPDLTVDLTSIKSIQAMYEKVGKVDAVVNTAGVEYYGPFLELTPELNNIAIESKLKGQMNLVLLGLDYVNDGGSFTLTTGITMDDPVPFGTSAAMANGGIKAFVTSAAISMPRGIRINSVSPNMLEESVEKNGHIFPGFEPVSSDRVALAYRKSVDGSQTGQSYNVY